MEIFDCHQHFGPSPMGLEEPPEFSIDADWKIRGPLLAKLGFDAVLLSPSNGFNRPNGLADTRRINDTAAEYRERHPERIVAALGIVEPWYGLAALEEIDRIARELKLNGLVFHHRFQGCTIDHWAMRPFLKRMADHGLVPFIHMAGGSGMELPVGLENLAREFPSMQFVALDGFSSEENGRTIVEMAGRVPNVSFDPALVFHMGRIRELVSRYGAERLLFGSNLYPSLGSPGFCTELNYCKALPVDEAERAKILGGNLRRILRLDR
jgi:predicted TIM-barrel fold metal-dependent hydrolase